MSELSDFGFEEPKVDFDVTEANAGMVARGKELILEGKYDEGIKLVNAGTENLVKLDKAALENEKYQDLKLEKAVEKAEKKKSKFMDMAVDVGKVVAPSMITGGIMLAGILIKEAYADKMFASFANFESEGHLLTGTIGKFIVDKVKDAFR